MAFDENWEALYHAGAHHSVWPWSDLISLSVRHVGALKGRRVLELGCGAGANLPFFLAAGAEYYGIDGSETAVRTIWERYPALVETVTAADFTTSLPAMRPVDVVVDRAALTHNDTRAIEHALKGALAVLKPGGWFIGVDWFSVRHSDRARGVAAEDEYTRRDFRSGQFQGCGRVHFSDEAHLRSLFSGFELEYLAEKTIRSIVPTNDHTFASFNIVARKPA